MQDGVDGGLLGITDLLLRAHVMATYLSRDWGRDWGSLRKFETVVDAGPAQLELGTATHSGWCSPRQDPDQTLDTKRVIREKACITRISIIRASVNSPSVK